MKAPGQGPHVALYEHGHVDMYIAPLSLDGKMAGRGIGIRPQ